MKTVSSMATTTAAAAVGIDLGDRFSHSCALKQPAKSSAEAAPQMAAPARHETNPSLHPAPAPDSSAYGSGFLTPPP